MTGQFSDLLAETIEAIDGLEVGSDRVSFKTANGEFVLFHQQDCCESVALNEIVGDMADLIGSPVVLAEEASNEAEAADPPPNPDSFTWTFYRLGTAKGTVVLRWLGESNGYYSESVDFVRLEARR